MAPLRFYFDFVSTFTYIAVNRVDAIAARHGRTVDWRVVSLGHLFQAQGVKAPPEIPAKAQYYGIDFPRSCARAGLPCKLPPAFPPDVKLARLVFWRLKARDEMMAHNFARAVSSAIYSQGQKVGTADEITAACCAVAGFSRDDVAAAAEDAAAKAALMTCLDDAKADGVFGAPFIIADGQPFWGADRLDALEDQLAGKRARS
jgi:2-hydroxychromene-2-carboxylate isomerase